MSLFPQDAITHTKQNEDITLFISTWYMNMMDTATIQSVKVLNELIYYRVHNDPTSV